MARRPYFSGNYGSALGSTANAANLIAQAGAVQGQMYANLGKQLGGAINSTLEKFREKKKEKESQERAENQFLNIYKGNPESPIFKSLGVQSMDEAKAVAKDISKDPQLVTQAMKFTEFAMKQEQAQEVSRFRDLQGQQIMRNMARQKSADKLTGEEQEKTTNFLNFLAQPGPNQIDPSGLDRNSVLRNIQAGKGATPPARMIPGPSPAEQSVMSPQAKQFIRRAIQQNQPIDKVLPMAKQIDQEIAQSQPKALDPFKVNDELRKSTEFNQGQDAITFTPERNTIVLGDTAYGISGKFGNEAEVIKLKSVEIPNYSNMNSVMNQLISLGEKRKTTKLMSNADKTLAQSLSNQLRGLLREQILGPGTVTDPERAILNEIVQNPTTWMDTAGNTQSKIDSLKGIRKDAFNKLKTRLTGLGLDVAEIEQGGASSPSKSSVDFNQETSSGLGYTEINLDQL